MEEVPEIGGGAELLSRLPAHLAASATRIATLLRESGHQAWIVGGAVRDLLLDRSPKDVDLVTDALPEEVEGLFERTVAVGISFGVVVVLDGDLQIEVATFREERGYSDRRRPDEIRYAADPAVDARRRDFTCNALFLDPLDGRLIDPTGGASDLAAGLLRTVGEPAERFREDGLRLLRMARFAASLALEPAPGLVTAAKAEADALEGVSPERVLDELLKIVRCAPPLRNVQRAVGILHACGLAERSLPGWRDGDEGEERVAIVGALEAILPPVAPELLLAALLPADAVAADGALRSLRASNELRESVRAIIAVEPEVAAAAGTSLTELQFEDLGALIELCRASAAQQGALLCRERLRRSEASAGETLWAKWSDLVQRSATAPDLPVELRAADLLEMGVARGPELGEGLRRVRHASLGGAFTDRDGALAWARASLR